MGVPRPSHPRPPEDKSLLVSLRGAPTLSAWWDRIRKPLSAAYPPLSRQELTPKRVRMSPITRIRAAIAILVTTLSGCLLFPEPAVPPQTAADISSSYRSRAGREYPPHWDEKKQSPTNAEFWSWSTVRERPFDVVPPSATLGEPGYWWTTESRGWYSKLLRVKLDAIAVRSETPANETVDYESSSYASEWSGLFVPPGTHFGTQYFLKLDIPAATTTSEEAIREPAVERIEHDHDSLVIVHQARDYYMSNTTGRILATNRIVHLWKGSEEIYVGLSESMLRACEETGLDFTILWSGGSKEVSIPPFYIEGFFAGPSQLGSEAKGNIPQ